MMEIIERDVSSLKATAPKALAQRGFPSSAICTVKDDDDDATKPTSAPGQKRKSLFARQVEKQREKAATVGPSLAATPAAAISGEESALVDGSGLGSRREAAAIHRESAAALAAMSEQERLAVQRQLTAGLDPALLAFVRSRRAAARPPPAADRGPAPAAARPPPAAEGGPTPAGRRQPPDESTPPPAGEDAMARLERVRDQLPIDPEAARVWPHMDRVEPEKLLWMTQLPAPDVQHGSGGFPARFDFQGDLLAYGADPPVGSALYHHGEEPGRAGYTVDEMYRLVRASVQQQRVLGLQTLAAVLRKCKSGVYDAALDAPLVPRLLDSGLLLLIRFALDDTTEPVISAALGCLEALLDNRPDEVCLDRCLCWSRGLEQPSLPTAVDTEPETAQQYRAEEAGMKDDAVTRLDACRALVRTDTLPRIRYILEVVRPPAPAVVSALRVLTRCARHSLQLAAEVAACPRLLDTLVTDFLPVCGTAPLEGCETVSQLPSVYGIPLHHAVKLVRVLASQGAQLAGRLVRQHRLMEALLSYVAVNPSESGMPSQEVLTLAIESYRLWTVLLSYGLGDTHFIEFFPLVIRQLHFFLSSVSVNREQASSRYNYDLGTWLVLLCRAAVCAAWSNHQTELLNRTGADLTSPGALRWGHVAGLLDPVEQCTRKWATEAARSPEELTDNGAQLLGACCQFLSAFHERWCRLGLDDTVARLQRLRQLADVTLTPLVTSEVCRRQLDKLREFSSLLSGAVSGGRRDPASLPSLGAVSWNTAEVSPLLRAGSPLPLVTPLLQLVRAAARLHPGLTETLVSPLLGLPAVSEYLAALRDADRLSLVGDWFSRYEIHLVTELLLLLSQQASPECGLLCHGVGLRLLACYQTADEHLCAELMRHVVFNRSLLPGPADGGADDPASAQLVSSCSLYERSLLRPAAAAAARDRADSLAGRVAALAAPDAGATLLPADWWYGPLVQLYERNNPQQGEEKSPAVRGDAPLHCVEPAQVASRCLSLVLLVFRHHRPLADALSVTAHFARVCCAFLAGDDLFLDANVQRAVRGLLSFVLSDPARLDLTADIPGLASFADLYTQLLDQFEGVSYGDPLFGAVVLVPLHPRHPAELRRLLWIERPHALRSVTTRPEQMLVPLEDYLSATEPDGEVRRAYSRALARGLITEKRNPALFRIASALSDGSS